MKAIDYAVQFLKDVIELQEQGETEEAAEKLATQLTINRLIAETNVMLPMTRTGKKRTARYNKELSTIFKEQDRKWKAIIRRLPDTATTLRPEAFWEVLVTRFEVPVDV